MLHRVCFLLNLKKTQHTWREISNFTEVIPCNIVMTSILMCPFRVLCPKFNFASILRPLLDWERQEWRQNKCVQFYIFWIWDGRIIFSLNMCYMFKIYTCFWDLCLCIILLAWTSGPHRKVTRKQPTMLHKNIRVPLLICVGCQETMTSCNPPVHELLGRNAGFLRPQLKLSATWTSPALWATSLSLGARSFFMHITYLLTHFTC